MSYQPYWMRRAHRNPHALAPIVYFPNGTDSDYTKGAYQLMRESQEWYYRVCGKTFRRLRVVTVCGHQTVQELQAVGGVYEIFRALLSECEKRGIKDGSGQVVSKCGLGNARGYIFFVPGPVNVGNMIGFEFPCGTKTAPPNANPLWPRPGMTGLSHKGMEVIAGKDVPYATQTEWYNPETGTYKHEWFASTPQQFGGAVRHEIGHILGIPHPHENPANDGMNFSDTIMRSWWNDRGLLPSEIETARANLLMR